MQMYEVYLYPPQSAPQFLIRIFFLQDNQNNFEFLQNFYFADFRYLKYYGKFDNFPSSISTGPSISSSATTSPSL